MTRKLILGTAIIVMIAVSLFLPRGSKVLIPAVCPNCQCATVPECGDVNVETYGFPMIDFQSNKSGGYMYPENPPKILVKGVIVNMLCSAAFISVFLLSLNLAKIGRRSKN